MDARIGKVRQAIAVGIIAVAAGVALAQTVERAPLRAPDIHYEPTPHNVVAEILALAKIGAQDIVYDLGCGDGRIVIAAVKQRGARGVCVDIDPQRIRESEANAKRAGVADRIVFLNRDLFEIDFADATVVTLFLSPSINLKLRPKLTRELRTGTRVISYVHGMDDWTPNETRTVQGAYGPRDLNLWIIAPR